MQERLSHDDRGIVDKDIKPAHRPSGRLDRAHHVIFIGDIHEDTIDLRSLGSQCHGARLNRCVAVGKHKTGSGCGKSIGQPLRNAAGATGYQHDLT